MKDKRLGTVYEIRTPGGSYVGSTINGLTNRWTNHITKLKKQEHHCKPLQKAWNEYGVILFSFHILEIDIQQDNLSDREMYWIKEKKSFASNKMCRIILKESFIENVISALKAGLTYRQIVKKHNISLGYITNIKRRYL